MQARAPFESIVYDLPTVIPSASYLQIISLGQDIFVADLLWIDSIEYIGSHALGRNEDVVYNYLDRVTDLDPHFFYAYQLGIFLLPENNNMDLAERIAQKGMEIFPDRWELPYYMAFNYQFFAEDYEKAAEYYLKASDLPNAPDVAVTLAASAKQKLNKYESALLVWKNAFETAKNEHVQKLAQERIEQLYEIVHIQKAIDAFRVEKNRMPESLQELIDSGYIESVLKHQYIIDQQGNILTVN